VKVFTFLAPLFSIEAQKTNGLQQIKQLLCQSALSVGILEQNSIKTSAWTGRV